jgi:hypothetical protein
MLAMSYGCHLIYKTVCHLTASCWLAYSRMVLRDILDGMILAAHCDCKQPRRGRHRVVISGPYKS